jgi:hypothetical protein
VTSMEKPQPANHLLAKLEPYWPTLLWLLFGLTVLLRLINLSHIPISADESDLALQTARIAKGQTGLASELPIYTGLTAVLFFIFGNANFWSRILPILVGSSLVFLPNLWKDQLDFKRVLLLNLAFSLMPTVTYFSRTIASPVFATAALLWLISLVRLRRWVLSGIAAACLWLSGSFALPLSLLALLGLVIARSMTSDTEKSASKPSVGKIEVLQFGSAWLVSVVLISTSFFLNPSGIGNIGIFFTTIPQLFRAWQPSELTRSTFLLLQYALIPLVFLILAWINFGKSSVETKSIQFVWLMMASLCLVLSFVNAGFLLPFSVLAWTLGIALINSKDDQVVQKRAIFVPLVIFGSALLIYVSIVAKTWANATYNSLALGLATGAGVLLFALAHGFVGLGWSPSMAKRALLTSLTIVLLAGTLASTFRLILAEPEKSALYWQSTNVYPDSVLNPLLSEFQKSANFKAGELMFRADAKPSAPYEWITRDLTGLTESQQGALPSVIITTTDKPGSIIENSYRGMVLASAETTDWSMVNLKRLVAGLFGSDLPITKFQTYLWVEKYFFSGK